MDVPRDSFCSQNKFLLFHSIPKLVRCKHLRTISIPGRHKSEIIDNRLGIV